MARDRVGERGPAQPTIRGRRAVQDEIESAAPGPQAVALRLERTGLVGTSTQEDAFVGGTAQLCQTEAMEDAQDKADAKAQEQKEQDDADLKQKEDAEKNEQKEKKDKKHK